MKRKSSPRPLTLLRGSPKRVQKTKLLRLEKQSLLKKSPILIGVDEAGRGPLAGPVVAGAVLLNRALMDENLGIRDSKKLAPKKRERLFYEILNRSSVGIGVISKDDIDRMNIYRATILAMEKAVIGLLLNIRREFQKGICILVDGKMKLNLPYKIKCIVGGDSKSLSIAAASIVAKVTRDNIMHLYDKQFPEYGFKTHKGYPTKAHISALRTYGPSPIHRWSFRPVRQWNIKD